MTRHVKSGLILIALGLAGIGFFWLTDVRFGPAGAWTRPGVWVDAAWQGWPGTLIGMVGSAVIASAGVWLTTRRAA